jgi:cyclophilin family peptidyl-prolyl cis-trans isomerase
MVCRRAPIVLLLLLHATGALAQAIPAARLAVLEAEDRRAPTARDLATLRSGARSSDPFTARLALRALGRLERPAAIPDIAVGLRHALPELRAEAANAIGQAARGFTTVGPSASNAVDSVLNVLVAQLDVEADPEVRAALCETIGRLPYLSAREAARAEQALLTVYEAHPSITDRLGVAKGFEALVRTTRTLHTPGADAIAALRSLVGVPADAGNTFMGAGDPTRDARVRRLALESLTAAHAVDAEDVRRAAADVDAQVRRLAMRAAATIGGADDVLAAGLRDAVAMVRLEAVRAVRVLRGLESCGTSISAAWDRDMHVSLLGIDQLSICAGSPQAVTFLENAVSDRSQAGVPRGWHRTAHALVALAAVAPEQAAAEMPRFLASRQWQVRMYAARAASEMRSRDALVQLAGDSNDNVAEAAIEGLASVGGHEHDAVYMAALSRQGYQVIRAAALALRGTPAAAAAIPALAASLQRLIDQGTDNSLSARTALAEALSGLGAAPPKAPEKAHNSIEVSSDELRRLAAPIARVTIRDVGGFDLALLSSEAPLTVLRFARLAEQGYYNGLMFHRVVPNFVLQGGSPGANEYVGAPDHMRDEVGLWPNVRGAVGTSTRGRDTGDAQIFVNIVDNPRFDHEYTVFAQILNGVDVIDRILEGDVIEKIEIVP